MSDPIAGMTREELAVYFNKQQLWVELRDAQKAEMMARRSIMDLEANCSHRLTEERVMDHHLTRWVYCRICDKGISHVAGT